MAWFLLLAQGWRGYSALVMVLWLNRSGAHSVAQDITVKYKKG